MSMPPKHQKRGLRTSQASVVFATLPWKPDKPFCPCIRSSISVFVTATALQHDLVIGIPLDAPHHATADLKTFAKLTLLGRDRDLLCLPRKIAAKAAEFFGVVFIVADAEKLVAAKQPKIKHDVVGCPAIDIRTSVANGKDVLRFARTQKEIEFLTTCLIAVGHTPKRQTFRDARLLDGGHGLATVIDRKAFDPPHRVRLCGIIRLTQICPHTLAVGDRRTRLSIDEVGVFCFFLHQITLADGYKVLLIDRVPEGEEIGLFTKHGHYISLISTDGKDFCILDPSYTADKFNIPERAGKVDTSHAPYLYCDVHVVDRETKATKVKYYMFSRKR